MQFGVKPNCMRSLPDFTREGKKLMVKCDFCLNDMFMTGNGYTCFTCGKTVLWRNGRMKVQKGLRRLNPKDFVAKKESFEIVEVFSILKSSKKGEYAQFTVQLLGKDGDAELSYLFNRDLNALIDCYGNDTDGWKGKMIDVSSHSEGEFFRWDITGIEVIK